MNAARRKDINTLLNKFSSDHLRSGSEDAEGIRDEEQEAFDNMPESLQSSERGQISEQYIEALETLAQAFNDLFDALDALEEIE